MKTRPEISSAFTIEDIRKIREWHGQRYAAMSRQEIAGEINNGARDFEALVKNARQTKQRDSVSITG